jgi:murein DD-endopeptidase MepM/ murein hydrolase activator NlpD
MKALTLLPTLVLLFSLSASAEVFDGSFERIVCASSSNQQVRGSDLDRVLFTVPNFSPVKVFQGWGENKRTKRVEGQSVTFVKVQFPEQGDKIGWIAESLTRARSRCEGAAITLLSAPAITRISDTSVRSLSDPACCQFPTKGEPTANYETEQRRFGASRSGGGRTHAACDLYRFKNEPIMSVAPGVVLRDPYPFYQGTYALEVRHNGGFVVRYGEITPKRVAGVAANREVSMGQQVGYMGKVSSNCCEPMLHFELYSGAKTGSLNVGGNKYKRRTDLMNPTSYLRRWEINSWRHRR